ncbi:MAG: molybdopterin-dependent oxidoreductase [Coriobacteriales bacterium]|jgi:trimethylamine-N-oxide reductase (cytochrome c)|nr:molybdopterin-dependent oxidoreductase [Coriobacteriales bacterium]
MSEQVEQEGREQALREQGVREQTVIRGIACGGTGGDAVAIDFKDGRIVRFRPLHWDMSYPWDDLQKDLWEFDIDGKVFKPEVKAAPSYFALAYKNRVYSKNRVRYPLKRVDWEPGGDPAKTNAQNRGISKFKRISWDEALDIIESELRRIIGDYGPFAVLCIGENGHRESKDLHSGGGMHATLMNELGGYTRETRTPDSVEGWYWGAKHVWGRGSTNGLGLAAPMETGYSSWLVAYDLCESCDLIAFQAGDLELTQNYAAQGVSRLIKYWEELGKEFVVIDPFCTYTAVCHETMKWIPILPNTDSALDFALMHVWLTEGLYQKDYVETHTVHFDRLRAYVLGEEDGEPKTPEWASPLCGVPEWTIKALARKWGTQRTSLAHFSSGSVKGPYSHENGRTAAYKMAMQGLGRPGVQQLHINALEMAKPIIENSTVGQMIMCNRSRMYVPTVQSIPRTTVAHAIQDGEVTWWGSPSIIWASTEDQFQEYRYPAPAEAGGTPIRMMWSEKPCNMVCWNGGFNYQDAIRDPQIEFFLTNHQWMENDSLFCDMVLPVSTCVEENDDVGAGMVVPFKYVALNKRACDPIGESMSDYQIALEIGRRFGVDENISLGMDEDEWFEYAFGNSRVSEEITWEQFKEKSYYIPKIDPDWKKLPHGMQNFYEDPEAYPLDTPTGKIEFWSDALAEHFPNDKERQPMARWMIGGPAEEGWTHDETPFGEKAKTYPLLLVSTAARWRVHVQGDDIAWFREIETCKVRGFDGYAYEPVWMTPEDAASRGIAAGDIVKVTNDQGTILCGARISGRVTPGSVMVHKGARVDPITDCLDRGGATNLISPPRRISQHCVGFAVTNYLVECSKLERAELEEWKRNYPEAFARDYDPAIGINYASWVEGGE